MDGWLIWGYSMLSPDQSKVDLDQIGRANDLTRLTSLTRLTASLAKVQSSGARAEEDPSPDKSAEKMLEPRKLGKPKCGSRS